MTFGFATHSTLEFDTFAHPEPEAGPDYRLRHPLQIAIVLRAFMARHEFLIVEFEQGQMYAQILDVDSRKGTFTFSFGNVDTDNHALLDSDELTFHNLPGSIHARFMTGLASKVRFDDRPAFEAHFPSALLHVQRREYFRVHTPLHDPFVALGRLADGTTFRYTLFDLSLGGIALNTPDGKLTNAHIGSILPNVMIELDGYGSVTVDLEVISPREVTDTDGHVRRVVGCRFPSLTGSAERVLQRTITLLETHRQTSALRA